MESYASVTVDEQKIDDFIQEMEQKISAEDTFVFDKWKDFHLSDIGKYSVEQLTAYVFVVNAMNFCFWPNNPSGQFEYEHMTRNLEKVLDTEPDFFTP